MEWALSTHDLHFSFTAREDVILREVDLSVPAGAAYGILGANGAGKSTLMKLLLGLLSPAAGSVRLLGQAPTSGAALFRRVGALIEEPHLYPHLSGYDNLRVFATYRQLPPARIGEVLDLTGLTAAAGRPVRQYSTGMRQRLGIALALLPDPELLILDEPTNGLDPQGIAEVRRLLQRLHREEGKTVVLSSHILSEVEQTCTHVGILHRGRLRFQGPIGRLRDRDLGGHHLLVETDEAEQALDVLRQHGLAAEALGGGQLQVMIAHRRDISGVVDLLRRARLAIYQVRLLDERLEDYFLNVLKEDL